MHPCHCSQVQGPDSHGSMDQYRYDDLDECDVSGGLHRRHINQGHHRHHGHHSIKTILDNSASQTSRRVMLSSIQDGLYTVMSMMPMMSLINVMSVMALIL